MVLYPVFSEENGNFQYFQARMPISSKLNQSYWLSFLPFKFFNRYPWIRNIKKYRKVAIKTPLASSLFYFLNGIIFHWGFFCLNKFWCNIVLSLKISDTDVHLINIRQSLLSVYIINYQENVLRIQYKSGNLRQNTAVFCT